MNWENITLPVNSNTGIFSEEIIKRCIALHTDPNRKPIWKYKPITTKQIEFLTKYKISLNILSLIDRGAAMYLINHCINTQLDAQSYIF